MRKCKGRYIEYDKREGRFSNKEFSEGLFHQWENAYEEFETGPGNFTVAIVELPDGKIVTPDAKDIQFIDREEN